MDLESITHSECRILDRGCIPTQNAEYWILNVSPLYSRLKVPDSPTPPPHLTDTFPQRIERAPAYRTCKQNNNLSPSLSLYAQSCSGSAGYGPLHRRDEPLAPRIEIKIIMHLYIYIYIYTYAKHRYHAFYTFCLELSPQLAKKLLKDTTLERRRKQ